MIEKKVFVNIVHELSIANDMTPEQLDVHIRKLLKGSQADWSLFDLDNGIVYIDHYPTSIDISVSFKFET
jgi:hypothetical protein